ncbi:hypothetical protein [Sphingobacterium faecale]|uniref:DUF4374 domain-containing protein n=1 Tax=Sphingobacterium faecale TaxID=2803775 RepID=A0ABS1R8B4_9SPHI|nr:hypothetical protein [Sphingobacterium faecale]MBL1410760.1 hypothetical protein [Sphingobacterium faecale]
MYFFNKLKATFLVSVLALAVVSCKDDPTVDKPDENIVSNKKYGIGVRVEAAGQSYNYILPVENLMKEGVVSPVGYGIDVTGKIDPTYGIQNGHDIYVSEATAIKKYSIASGDVKELDNVVIDYSQTYSSFMAKTAFMNNTLNVLSYASYYDPTTETRNRRVFIIDTAKMILKADNPVQFPVPLIKDPNNPEQYLDKSSISVTPTSFGISKGKLFVGYKNNKQTDIAYVLIADYPSLTNQKVASVSGYGTVSGSRYQTRSSFFDEEGNFYFTTMADSKFYTLLRIKAGTTAVDPDYIFDLSNYQVYEEGYGGTNQDDQHTYIKEGKALIGGYVFDIRNKKLVKNLNDSGYGKVQTTSGDGIHVDGANIYVFVKSADSKYYVVRYNLDTNEVKRGLEIGGGINYAMGIVQY